MTTKTVRCRWVPAKRLRNHPWRTQQGWRNGNRCQNALNIVTSLYELGRHLYSLGKLICGCPRSHEAVPGEVHHVQTCDTRNRTPQKKLQERIAAIGALLNISVTESSILSGLLCHRASASFSSLNLRPSIGPKASSRNKSLAPGRRPAVSPDSGKLPLQVADRSRGSPNLSEGAVFKSWFTTSSKSWFTNFPESWFANLARAVPDSRRSTGPEQATISAASFKLAKVANLSLTAG